jgi:DNA polymerase elongation subunit (family B)
VYNNEGVEYTKPKLKITGLEAIKSSTPSACREKIKQAIEVIINQDEDAVIRFIEQFRIDFKQCPVADIAFPRGVNGLQKYSDVKSIYGTKTPIHVRGSLMFNHFINEKRLQKKYQTIKEGEKIKFIYLKEPNPIQSSVISFLSSIPKEFDLEKYIDYDTQFEKSFIEPLKIILDAIDWRVQKTNSLEDFFS